MAEEHCTVRLNRIITGLELYIYRVSLCFACFLLCSPGDASCIVHSIDIMMPCVYTHIVDA